MAIKLAANFIPTTGTIGGNWGHLQIVNSSTGEEIEVQSGNMNPIDEIESTTPFFDYEPLRPVSSFTPGHSGATDTPEYRERTSGTCQRKPA